MQAHKALEGLQKIRNKGVFDVAILDLLEEKLTESQKFEFDFGEFPVMSEKELNAQVQRLNLPYVLCYFGVPRVGGILARDNKDWIMLQVFMQRGTEVGVLPPQVRMFFDKRDGNLRIESEHPHITEELLTNDPAIVAASCLAGLVVRGLSVLNCSNVAVVDNQPSMALNKKRLKSGKPPTFTYKTLHIKTGFLPLGQSARSLDGARHGPRLHLRRGHIRRIHSGLTTWVQSAMVGSATSGMVMKDYRVTA